MSKSKKRIYILSVLLVLLLIFGCKSNEDLTTKNISQANEISKTTPTEKIQDKEKKSNDNQDSKDIFEKAMLSNDISICQNFEHDLSKDLCVGSFVNLNKAIQTKNIEYCINISVTKSMGFCLKKMYLELGTPEILNVSLCQKSKAFYYIDCIAKIAELNKELFNKDIYMSACDIVSNELSKGECIHALAIKFEEPLLCSQIIGPYATGKIPNCFTQIARKKKNESICDKITDVNEKNKCIINVRHAMGII